MGICFVTTTSFFFKKHVKIRAFISFFGYIFTSILLQHSFMNNLPKPKNEILWCKSSLCKSKLFFFITVLVLLFTGQFYGQNNIIALEWDQEVGCQTYAFDDTKRIFISEIENSTCVNVCAQSEVNYTLTGDVSSIANVEWSITGGIQLNTTPTHCFVKWGNPGGGIIEFTITFNDQSTLTRSLCISKIEIPQADFEILGLPYSGTWVDVCVDQDVNFHNLTDTSGGGNQIVAYHWDFGDGTTSNAENPIHQYVNYANNDVPLEVTLTVTNSCNCSSIYKIPIKVKKKGVTIECPGVICENGRATYSVSPIEVNGCNSLAWTVEGGHIINQNNNSVEVNWDMVGTEGFGYVSVNTVSCNMYCQTISTIAIPVIQTNGTISGPATVCKGSQTHYSLPQWPATLFNWELLDPNATGASLILTDQRNEVIISAENNGGLYLKCNYYNTLLKCGGSAIIKIDVFNPIVISGEKLFCTGETETYHFQDENGNPVYAYWYMNGPNNLYQGGYLSSSFTYHFTTPGTYIINAFSGYYCSPEPFVIEVKTSPSTPIGIIGPNAVCPQLPLVYSVQDPDPQYNYHWEITNNAGNFIGSNVGTEVTISFSDSPTYNNYSISVIAVQRDEPHCSSGPFTKNIERIQPNFNIIGDNQVCSSTSSTYNTDYPEGDDYIWSIIPSHAGTITSGNGSTQINVLWNSTQLTTPPLISLHIRKCNQLFQETKQITIIESPTVQLTGDAETCRNQNAHFSLTVPPGSPAISSLDYVEWNFGDGTTEMVYPGNSPLSQYHTYNDLSTSNLNYTVTATIYGANGCFIPSIATFEVTVKPSPVIFLSPYERVIACEEEDFIGIVSFTVNIEQGYGENLSIQWLQDGLPIPNENGTTYYPQNFGAYSVLVTNEFGCTTTSNESIIVQECGNGDCNGAPTVPPITVLQNDCDTFTASLATPVSPAPDLYHWEYSGGISITPGVNSAVLQVQAPGNYWIAYIASNNIGPNLFCYDSEMTNFYVPYMADLLYTINCDTGGNYSVTLNNHSQVAPGQNINTIRYFVDGVWHNVNSNSFTIPGGLAPGNHQIGIAIEDSGNFPVCEKILDLSLPNLPIATFTPNTLTTCPDSPIQFVPTDTQAGNLYLWSFGDNSQNFQQSPIKSYANINDTQGERNVTLTVTNSLGCTATYSYPGFEIQIYPGDMDGTIEPAYQTICEGSAGILEYNQNLTSLTIPTLYTWYMEGNPLPVFSSTDPYYSPTQNGTYWLEVTDANGCSKKIGSSAIVAVLRVPDITIDGPTVICEGSDIRLNGYAGDNLLYEWKRNGVVVGSEPTVSYTEDTAGIYTYTLTLRLAFPGGGFCQKSFSHTVTVLPPPAPIYIELEVLSCENYKIEATAYTNETGGTFTWSNGTTGISTTVTTGGPLWVRYTSASGCSTTEQVMIPHPPSYYMWVFPRGCYTFCAADGTTPGELIGPLEPQEYWGWLLDDHIEVEEYHTAVSTYPVTHSGAHQLVFATSSLCPEGETSPILAATVTQDCDKCGLEVIVDTLEPQEDEYGQVYYTGVLKIINNSTVNFYATISNTNAPVGTFSPSGVVVAPNNNTFYTFVFIPGAAFTYDIHQFTLSSESNGHFCADVFEVEFPPLRESGKLENTTPTDETAFRLVAVPNPAENYTTVYYATNGAVPESIEVLDLTGRLILHISCENAHAQRLNTAALPTGSYIVILKDGSQILGSTRLIKN